MFRRVGRTLLLLGLLASAALADSRARIVRLSFVEGEVKLDQREGQGYDRAYANMPVTEGTRVWTRGGDALAEIELEDGSTIRLAPDTIVEFEEMGLRSSGERVTSLELQQGTAYFDVKDKDQDLRVTFGGQQLSLEKSSRFRLWVDRDQVKLAVFKGEVEVRSGANRVEVRKNETFTVELSDPDRYLLAKGIDEDGYDAWDQERAEYRQTYAARANSYSGYSSAYMYGVSDLNYYGNYSYAPGWGWVWRPSYVGTGWSPFLDGAWMWYPGYGYMWVSAYPWGWLPYRYGSWIFVPSHGWCWQPAHRWSGWSPVTMVRNAPSNWHAPRPPSSTPRVGGPAIVPVGRGPRTIQPDGLQAPGGRVIRQMLEEGRQRQNRITVGPSGGVGADVSGSAGAQRGSSAVTPSSVPSGSSVGRSTHAPAAQAPPTSSRGRESDNETVIRRGPRSAPPAAPPSTPRATPRATPSSQPPPPQQQQSAPRAVSPPSGGGGRSWSPPPAAPPSGDVGGARSSGASSGRQSGTRR